MRKRLWIKNILVSAALISSLAITEPIYVKTVNAAEIEDCDLDGYDDHTGNPVPWIGFDSTKGEAIPGDWDHSTIYKSVKAYQDAHTKKEEPKDTASDSSGKDSKTSGSKSSSSTGSSSGKGNTSNQSSGKTAKGKTEQVKTGKSSTTTSNAAKKNSNGKSSEAKEAGEEETTTSSEETTEVKKDKKKKHKKKNKKAATKNAKGKSAAVKATDDEETSDEETALAVGTLKVDEADGSIIHAGSNLIVSGTDFEGNVDGIEIEIHSDNHILLGYANTVEDGSFESEVSIPENLPAGTHEIALVYQENVIATKTIQVGAKVADTFLGALTVGFTSQNSGLIPGLLLLAGLFAAGIFTLIGGKVVEKTKA
jgi:hypothetical protein